MLGALIRGTAIGLAFSAEVNFISVTVELFMRGILGGLILGTLGMSMCGILGVLI